MSTDAPPVDLLLPEHDPFMADPADLAGLAPGALIRSRRVEVAFLGRIRQKLEAWQLLYRTTDLNGAPEASITTVLLPYGADPREPRPLVAYQCAIDAISSRCFPSYLLRTGANPKGSFAAFELLVLAGLLRRGWAISVCDHEGLKGRFGAAREPGYRVLDGIRAVLGHDDFGMDASTQVGLIGYSGGGMASSWAAEMAPTYAPDLNIIGAVLGAPVGDPGETFIRLNGGFFAGLPAMVVAGLRSGYPGLESVIDEHASREGRSRLDLLTDMSTIEAIRTFRGDDFDDYLDSPLADVLATPEVLHVFEDLRLGQHIPQCPILGVQAIHDQIIHIEDVDGQMQRYIDGGATVRYLRDGASDHILLQPIATPLMLGWLSDRFAGKPAPSGTRTVRSLALRPMSLPSYLGMAVAAVKTIFGRPHTSRRPHQQEHAVVDLVRDRTVNF